MTEESCMASSHIYDINVSLRISCRVLKLSDCIKCSHLYFLENSQLDKIQCNRGKRATTY